MKPAPRTRDDSARNRVRLDRLIDAASRARERAYAPYSRYAVGAAIETASGKVFAGCNVENASYGACLCAERNAVAQMVVAGESSPVACAVVTGGRSPGAPCGICRQVLSEFAPDLLVVLVADGRHGRTRVDTTLASLLPLAFRLQPRSRPRE
jgi:cytidine deaminase